MSTEHKRTPICQEKGSKPISIDPQAITHAFIALTHGDLKHSADAKEIIAKMNRHCQPKLWNVKFHVKFVTFGASASYDGFPEPSSIGPALERVGLEFPSSIVANTLELSFDGGETATKLFAGFAFRDDNPRFILPYSGGCVAKGKWWQFWK
jgi:hypothetical protein